MKTDVQGEAQRGETLGFLQAGRGLAASLVVAFHLGTTIFDDPKYWPEPLWPGFQAGHAGVYFFFVLSGFVMAWVHAKDINHKDEITLYLLKRAVRIYPAYWILLICIVPLYFLLDGTGEGYETDWQAIVSSAILWPTPQFPVLPVAWTLRHEVLFYILFVFLLIGRFIGTALLCAWFVFCTTSLFTHNLSFPWNFLFSPLNLLFPLGMVSAWAVKKKFPLPALSLLLAGLITFAGCGWLDVRGHGSNMLALGYGVASTFIITGGVTLEQNGRIRTPAIFNLLGNASYSIYLIHYPALSLLARIYFLLNFDQLLPREIGFASLFAGSILAGIAFHGLVEKPLMRQLKPQTITKRLATLRQQPKRLPSL